MNEQTKVTPVSEKELNEFVEALQEKITAEHAERKLYGDAPSMTAQVGKKYARIVQNGSAYCFIRLEDGAILKPAGWASPAKRFRGSIRPLWWGTVLNYYGVNYLR